MLLCYATLCYDAPVFSVFVTFPSHSLLELAYKLVYFLAQPRLPSFLRKLTRLLNYLNQQSEQKHERQTDVQPEADSIEELGDQLPLFAGFRRRSVPPPIRFRPVLRAVLALRFRAVPSRRVSGS